MCVCVCVCVLFIAYGKKISKMKRRGKKNEEIQIMNEKDATKKKYNQGNR